MSSGSKRLGGRRSGGDFCVGSRYARLVEEIAPGLWQWKGLQERIGSDCVDVTLIDKSDAFVFGYSKLDVNGGCVW